MRKRFRYVILGVAGVAVAAGIAVVSLSGAGTSRRTLPHGSQLYAARFLMGAEAQRTQLLGRGDRRDAALVRALEQEPMATWLVNGSPREGAGDVAATLRDAGSTVPVFVVYYLPGRDCGGYSAGGATTKAQYETWVAAVARALGDHAAMVILEPDGLGLIPSVCPGGEAPYTDAERYAELRYAVAAFERQPHALVYLDGTHSHWLNVGDAAKRLVAAGVDQAQGFFLNVSNYRSTASLLEYGTWISDCIALGHYDRCASEYHSPLGKVDPDKPSTWHFTDEWYAKQHAHPRTHFVLDTSRNGQGSWTPTRHYSDPQDWCNPPNRGLGPRPTLHPGHPLVDAYLWVKIPGESDGSCGRGARTTVDPEWSKLTGERAFMDPSAGQWFPQQVLQLIHLARPPLRPSSGPPS